VQSDDEIFSMYVKFLQLIWMHWNQSQELSCLVPVWLVALASHSSLH